MPLTVWELDDSRRLSGVSSFIWKFGCKYTNDIDAVADAVYFYSPTNYGFWIRDWMGKSITPQGGGLWHVEVPYNVGSIPLLTPGEGGSGGGGGSYTPPTGSTPIGPEWSIDFSAGSVQERRSREVIGGKFRTEFTSGDPVFGDIAPIVGGGPIGFDPSSGTTEGVAVPKGVQRRELTVKVSGVTTAYLKKLENRQFGVNVEAFLDREPGEVRFDGARLQSRYADGVTLSLTFAIAKNQTNLEVGRFLVLPKVEGWDYVDPTYSWIKDPDDPSKMIREVTAATIHRVHPRIDLWEVLP